MAPKKRISPEEGNNEVENKNSDEESVDSRSSCESASSDSDDDSSTESPPPPESINGDQIRHNARQLLQASPDTPKTTGAAMTSTNDHQPNAYQSYHDAPTVRMSSISSADFSNPAGNTATATPPWANQNDGNEGGLSMTDVASLAFACVAQCITEGYRAASTYYGGYENSQYYPAVSSSGNGSHNYDHVGGYQNDNESFANPNNSGNESYKNSSNGYSDGSGYQTKSFSDNPIKGHGEVMDRGMSSSQQASQSSGQDTEQNAQQEWATVPVPSTYQGGILGNDRHTM